MQQNTKELVPLVVRASSVHRLCTNKPKFDINVFNTLEEDFVTTLEKKKLIFEPDQIDLYCETDGIKTKAQTYRRAIEERERFEKDPLPEGAKTYIQELWLELNYNFYSVTLNSNDPKLLKGHAVEDDAIVLLGQYYNLDIKKNVDRVVKGILTGECDVKYQTTIRDTKCPEDWASFRKKNGVETAYYWQLIAYCYLYDCTEAFLDYLLMKTPEHLFQMMTQYLGTQDIHKLELSNNQIDSLPLSQRIKTYEIQGIADNIEFLINRLEKAEDYYNSLTYEECMNLIQ